MIWSLVVGIFTLAIPHLICDIHQMLAAKQVTKKPSSSKAAKVMHRVHKITNSEKPKPSNKPKPVQPNNPKCEQSKITESNNRKPEHPKVVHPNNPNLVQPKTTESNNPKPVQPAFIEPETSNTSSFNFLDLPEECRLRILNLAANRRFAVSSSLSDNKHYAADPKFRLINKEMRDVWDRNLKLINQGLILQAGNRTVEIDGEAVEIPWLLYHLPQGQTEIECFKSISTLLHKRAKMMAVDIKPSKHLNDKNRLSYELTLASRLVRRMRREDENMAHALEVSMREESYRERQELLAAQEESELQEAIQQSLIPAASQTASESL